MVSGKKIEKLRTRIENRISEVKDPLDFQNGCLYCYRKRMPGSLYCCEEHQREYEFHNGKPIKQEDDS